MIVALDFDGTLATHRWPKIGEDIGAFKWLIPLQEQNEGLRYILWTVRTYKPLSEAIKYCDQMGIKFWGINRNPEQHKWSSSNKAHAHLYIDDTALGAPLIYRSRDIRPYIDWDIAGPKLRTAVAEYFVLKNRMMGFRNK